MYNNKYIWSSFRVRILTDMFVYAAGTGWCDGLLREGPFSVNIIHYAGSALRAGSYHTPPIHTVRSYYIHKLYK